MKTTFKTALVRSLAGGGAGDNVRFSCQSGHLFVLCSFTFMLRRRNMISATSHTENVDIK